MPPLPSRSDLKTYLGLTGSADDALLDQLRLDAIAQAESDTGRRFASGSNSSTTYSSDGQALIVVHDRPLVDASRTVTVGGVTMTEGTNVWFLPDRRDSTITTTLQVRYFDTGRGDWYKADPQWWDKNLDRHPYSYGSQPNDIVIEGIIGHPFPRSEIGAAIKLLWATLYWRAKSGASGTVYTPTGEPIDISDWPEPYKDFVRNWKIRTAVASVG